MDDSSGAEVVDSVFGALALLGAEVRGDTEAKSVLLRRVSTREIATGTSAVAVMLLRELAEQTGRAAEDWLEVLRQAMVLHQERGPAAGQE
jgi:hypothetical protein